jgi:ABC-type hemin transport system substrate-binding protein
LQWLEAVVNNGTSQIQGIAMNVDRLCKELGQDDSQQSLVTDIRQLISGMKARDQNFAALQAAVLSLLEVLTASQTQRGAGMSARCLLTWTR